MTFRAASESGSTSPSDCGQPAWQNAFGREAGIHGGGGGAGDGGGGGDGGGSGQSGLLGSWNVEVAVTPFPLPAGVAPWWHNGAIGGDAGTTGGGAGGDAQAGIQNDSPANMKLRPKSPAEKAGQR